MISFSPKPCLASSGARAGATRSASGRDQVFLRVIGDEAIYLVDANLLKLFPRQANDWRDTTFISLKGLVFDRLMVTSGARFFELQRDASDKIWRMTQPMKARADNPKVEDLLQKLQNL